MHDEFSERAVVLFLGTFALFGLGGLIWLIDHGSVSDAALLAIIAGPTGGALGALGTLLARVGGASDVRVTNEPTEPLPTTDVAGPKVTRK